VVLTCHVPELFPVPAGRRDGRQDTQNPYGVWLKPNTASQQDQSNHQDYGNTNFFTSRNSMACV